MIEAREVAGNIALAMPMFYPSQCAVIEHHYGNWDILGHGGHQSIHANSETAITANSHHLAIAMDQFSRQCCRNRVTHSADATGLEKSAGTFSLKIMCHEDAILARVA